MKSTSSEGWRRRQGGSEPQLGAVCLGRLLRPISGCRRTQGASLSGPRRWTGRGRGRPSLKTLPPAWSGHFCPWPWCFPACMLPMSFYAISGICSSINVHCWGKADSKISYKPVPIPIPLWEFGIAPCLYIWAYRTRYWHQGSLIFYFKMLCRIPVSQNFLIKSVLLTKPALCGKKRGVKYFHDSTAWYWYSKFLKLIPILLLEAVSYPEGNQNSEIYLYRFTQISLARYRKS